MSNRSVSPGQILVIEPAVRFPNLDCFNRLALASPLPLSYHLPALYGFASLEATSLELVRGIIVLGSAASVNDRLPWLERLSHWLRELWARRVPTLGVCFGHQLIAHLFGGRVGLAFPDGEKRREFRRISLHEPPAWLAREGELELYLSHREAVLECPAELRVFASSEAISIEAIAHRQLPIYGFQAHPEATPLWVVQHGLDLDDPGKQLADGQRLVGSFLQRCASIPAGADLPAPSEEELVVS